MRVSSELCLLLFLGVATLCLCVPAERPVELPHMQRRALQQTECPLITLELRFLQVSSRLITSSDPRIVVQCATLQGDAFDPMEVQLSAADEVSLFKQTATFSTIFLPVAQIGCDEEVSCAIEVQAQVYGMMNLADRIFNVNTRSDCWFKYENFVGTSQNKTQDPVWVCQEHGGSNQYALGCAECSGRIPDGQPSPVMDRSSWSTSSEGQALSPTLIIVAGAICSLALLLVVTAIVMRWRRGTRNTDPALELMARAGDRSSPPFKPPDWYEAGLEGGQTPDYPGELKTPVVIINPGEDENQTLVALGKREGIVTVQPVLEDIDPVVTTRRQNPTDNNV